MWRGSMLVMSGRMFHRNNWATLFLFVMFLTKVCAVWYTCRSKTKVRTRNSECVHINLASKNASGLCWPTGSEENLCLIVKSKNSNFMWFHHILGKTSVFSWCWCHFLNALQPVFLCVYTFIVLNLAGYLSPDILFGKSTCDDLVWSLMNISFFLFFFHFFLSIKCNQCQTGRSYNRKLTIILICVFASMCLCPPLCLRVSSLCLQNFLFLIGL